MREVKVIPSKSDAHRAMICAALAEIQSGLNGDRACKIICDETSKDMDATAKCLEALKEALSGGPGAAEPDSRGEKPGEAERTKPAVLMCGESGSTLRFLLPVTAALGVSGDFMPEGRLPQRPLSPLYEEMTARGCKMSPQGSVPFKVRGKLRPGKYTYYHMISGTHFPLKSQNALHSFFDSTENGIVLQKMETGESEIDLKLRRVSICLGHYNSENRFVRTLSQFIWKIFLRIQYVCGYGRNRQCVFWKSSQWCSLTEEAVAYMLSVKREVLRKYRYSFCGDEFFVYSELYDSP